MTKRPNMSYFFSYSMLASLHVPYTECRDDICQWRSSLYPCFVHRLMIVPESSWERIGWEKHRAPAADGYSLSHSTGSHPHCNVFRLLLTATYNNFEKTENIVMNPLPGCDSLCVVRPS